MSLFPRIRQIPLFEQSSYNAVALLPKHALYFSQPKEANLPDLGLSWDVGLILPLALALILGLGLKVYYSNLPSVQTPLMA
jgi:hypothetical protein